MYLKEAYMKEDSYKKAKVIIAVAALVIVSVLGWAHVINDRYYYHTESGIVFKHDKWTNSVTVNQDFDVYNRYRSDKKESGYKSITYDL